MPNPRTLRTTPSAEADAMQSPELSLGPLFLPGWLEYNRRRWGVVPVRRTFRAEDAVRPALEVVYYLDRRGRVTSVPRNPYLPAVFTPTSTDARPRLYRQWLEVADLYAAELSRIGLARAIALSPEVTDIRAWQWRRMRAGLRYTFYVDFPFRLGEADNTVRKNRRKADEAGYTVGRETDMKAVYSCLKATEMRQGFTNDVSVADLELARELMGDQHLRAYTCRAPNGRAVSARVVLHDPRARAIDWLAGTEDDHVRTGATQQLIAFVLQDLSGAGATGFDFAGADHRHVAAPKADWGGRLVSYPVLEAHDLRLAVKTARDVAKYWWSKRRARTETR